VDVIMDWALLLVIVPAIVAPVVLLYGYCGCKFDPQRGPLPPAAPTLLRVIATDVDRIDLAWDYLDPPPEPVAFEIRHDQTDPPLATIVGSTAFQHAGLAEGTAHSYEVRAVRASDLVPSEWVPVPPLVAMTRRFEVIFSSAGIAPNPQNGVNQANDTLVQRINAVTKGGAFVRITLRGIVNETTVLTAVSVSGAAPAGAMEPWDSADPPRPVTFGGGGTVNLAGNGTAVSDKIRYDVVQGQDLLVALNVGAASGRVLRRDVPGAVTFIGNNRAEAAQMDRTAGYNTDNDRAYCIELIEVA
jgi:hypothetical protein